MIHQLVKLEEYYEEIRRYNKILKDGSHIYLLKKLKGDFEDYKLKYKNKTSKLDDVKKGLQVISYKIINEKHKLQDKEAALSQAESKDYKIMQEISEVIKNIKLNIKKLEDEALILMEEEEGLEIEKEKLRIELLNIKNNFYAKKEEVNSTISDAHNKIRQCESSAIKLKETLPKDIQKKFEYLVGQRSTAVVELQGGMCLGCRMKVSVLVLDTVHKGETIVFCDNCERILYYNPSNSQHV